MTEGGFVKRSSDFWNGLGGEPPDISEASIEAGIKACADRFGYDRPAFTIVLPPKLLAAIKGTAVVLEKTDMEVWNTLCLADAPCMRDKPEIQKVVDTFIEQYRHCQITPK